MTAIFNLPVCTDVFEQVFGRSACRREAGYGVGSLDSCFAYAVQAVRDGAFDLKDLRQIRPLCTVLVIELGAGA